MKNADIMSAHRKNIIAKFCVGLGLRIVARIIGPVALYLFGPIAISLPGIQRWIDTNPTPAWRRCFRYPTPILLPTVCVVSCRLFWRHVALGFGSRRTIVLVFVDPLDRLDIGH